MWVKSPKKDATRMPPPKVSGPSSFKKNKNLVPELDDSHVSNKVQHRCSTVTSYDK